MGIVGEVARQGRLLERLRRQPPRFPPGVPARFGAQAEVTLNGSGYGSGDIEVARGRTGWLNVYVTIAGAVGCDRVIVNPGSLAVGGTIDPSDGVGGVFYRWPHPGGVLPVEVRVVDGGGATAVVSVVAE